MRWMRAHPVATIMILVALVFTAAIATYGIYLADMAGKLPWQVDPTRIPVTPFSDFPGFNSTPTPAASPGV